MSNPLELLLPEEGDNQDYQEFTKATIESLDPIRIRFDGETIIIGGTPDTLVHPSQLAVGLRVHVLRRIGKNSIILGIAGGEDIRERIGYYRGTTAQREALALTGSVTEGTMFFDTDQDRQYTWLGGAWVRQLLNSSGTSAQRAATTPMLGDLWRDTNGNKYVWKGSSTGVWRRLSGVEVVSAGSWDNSASSIYARTISKSVPTAIESSERLFTSVNDVSTGFGSISLSDVGGSNWSNLTTLATFRHYQFMNAQTRPFSFSWQVIDV